jgi:putative glutamine amidotransferase
LRATAWSPDGIIEAVQSSDGYPLLALQCHPERLWEARPEFLKPFEWLVDVTGRKRR